MNDDIATVLRALEQEDYPRVHRFDRGDVFRQRIAILPSAFNPPTLAHLRLMELARELDDIVGSAALLSTRNVDKGIYGADLADRVGMLLALHGPRGDFGVLASNAARIMDQARALREQHSGIGFDFVVGFDTLVRVFDRSYYDNMPRDLEFFFSHHRLIATNRAEWTVEEVHAFLDRPEVRDFAALVIVRELDPEPAQFSSTAEREALEQGAKPRALPPEVLDYIQCRGLYRDDETSPAK